MKYLTDVDMNHNKISNLVLENSSGSPSTYGRQAGEILYDSSNKTIKIFNGTEWNTIDDLTIQKLETAEDGYSTSYELVKNGVSIGDKINIPKDLVVESGTVKTVETENTPVEGYVVGDKYIDLVIANSNDEHIYVLVSDLVEGVGEYYFLDGVKKGEIFNDYSNNKAIGKYSHAEGIESHAEGECSHTEGYCTTAIGDFSHAEGYYTMAAGDFSHAGGKDTTAIGEAQTVLGKYNVGDTEKKYAFIIGNGVDDSNRNNLLTISWDGSLVVDNIKNTLDATLIEGLKYQLGELFEETTLNLPESATSDIEVDFAVADTTYAIACDYLSLEVVANTYYQIIFSYDKALNTWFASVVSSDYTPVSTTSEVSTDETT